MFTVIELDKTRTLRYGYKSLILMEELLGTTMGKIQFDNVSMMDLAKILYAGLKHEDKDLTIDSLIDILDEQSDIAMISEMIGKAITDAFGKNDKAPMARKPR
jgi:DNA-binding protein YbaB